MEGRVQQHDAQTLRHDEDVDVLFDRYFGDIIISIPVSLNISGPGF